MSNNMTKAIKDLDEIVIKLKMSQDQEKILEKLDSDSQTFPNRYRYGCSRIIRRNEEKILEKLD